MSGMTSKTTVHSNSRLPASRLPVRTRGETGCPSRPSLRDGAPEPPQGGWRKQPDWTAVPASPARATISTSPTGAATMPTMSSSGLSGFEREPWGWSLTCERRAGSRASRTTEQLCSQFRRVRASRLYVEVLTCDLQFHRAGGQGSQKVPRGVSRPSASTGGLRLRGGGVP